MIRTADTARMPTLSLPAAVSPSADDAEAPSEARSAFWGGWGWLGAYFGAWAAVAGMYVVILSIAAIGKGWYYIWHLVAYSATSWGVRSLLLLPGVWLAMRVPFTRRGWPLALLVHVPAGVALGTAKAAIYVWLSLRFEILDDTALRGYLTGDLPFNVLSYWGVVAAVHGWQYYGRFRERERAAAELQLRASRLEARLARAQLDALKMQLQPHFLFNTLHSISALIHSDPEAADLMVSRLSEFLRLVLDNAGAQEERLAVHDGGRVFFLRTAEIDWIESAGNYLRLHVGKEQHLVRGTLKSIEPRLDPERFLRIHRSTLVNLDRVREIHPWFNGEYVLTLHDGTRLESGWGYGKRVREAIRNPL